MTGSLLGILAAALAVPALAKPLSPRELAGIPLAKHVAPIRAISLADRDPEAMSPVSINSDDSPFRISSLVAAADPPKSKNSGMAMIAAKQIEYVTDVVIGGQKKTLIIDTGSTDTWVVKKPFRCLDMNFRTPVDETQCKFGSGFEGDFSGGHVPDVELDIRYGALTGGFPYIKGSFGYSDIEVAGVKLNKLQIGMATEGAWRGDNISSGILGLGLSESSASVKIQGQERKHMPYDGFVERMDDEGIPSMFALALSRNKSASYLSFGGVPDVKTGPWATTGLIRKFNDTELDPVWGGRYMIQIDSFKYNGSQSGASVVRPLSFPVLLDSGTTLNILPDEFALAINSAFDPPAVFDRANWLFFVNCNAKPPRLTWEWNGTFIETDGASLIFPELKREDGRCATGVTATRPAELGGSLPIFVFGDTFFQELVVLFDVAKQEIKIAKRM